MSLPSSHSKGSHNHHKVSHVWLALITLILFGAFVFRLWNLGLQSLWHDEAWAVYSAYDALNVYSPTVDPNAPPIFYMTLGFWQRVAGDEVWTMRYWSLLYGVIMVAVAALLARRWFGRGAALLAALLVAISPPMWVFSQEIRAYSVMPLYALILLGLLQWYLRCTAEVGESGGSRPAPTGKVRRALIWLLLIEMMTLYTHNLSVPIVAWLNVSAVIGLAVQRQWRRVGQWIAIHIGMLLLYLPWLITQRPTGTPLNTPPSLSFDLLLKIWQSYFTGINQMLLPQNAETVAPLMRLIAVFGVIALVGIVLALLRRDRRVYVLASQVILIPVFESAIILAAHIDFHPRYFVAAVPATLMLIAAGWGREPHPLSPPLHSVARGKPTPGIGRVVRWAGLAVAVGLAAAITINMTTLLFSNIGYQHDQFVVAARRYTYLNADDAIVIPYGWEPTLDYYKKKLNIKAKVIAIPLYASFDTIAERLTTELKGVKNVELFDWYPLPADMRGVIPCLLSTDRNYMPDAPSLIAVDVNTIPFVYSGKLENQHNTTTADIRYGGGLLKLVRSEQISGLFGTCVVTYWQISQPIKDNLSLLVRASDTNGQELKRHNVVMRDDKQLPTSFWKVGQTYTVTSRIWPFRGAYGDFPLTATVYSENATSGLDAYLNGQIVGKEAPIGKAVGLPISPDWANQWFSVYREACPSIETPAIQPIAGTDSIPYRNVLRPGERFHAFFEWWNCGVQAFASDPKANITLVLEGDGWRTESPYRVPPSAMFKSLHVITVPPQAQGKAKLYRQLPDGSKLGVREYTLEEITRAFTPLSMPFPTEVRYRDLGSLIGVDTPTEIKKGEGISIKLQWKASATATIPYTVFVHLLDSEGRVIAQSDQQPAKNARPTTSWIEGEYILDEHQLGTVSNYTGAAKLEIGLYDAKTNQRLKLENGDDHVVLPINITVK